MPGCGNDHICLFRPFARLNRIGGNAVGVAGHLLGIMNSIADPNAAQPFLRTAANPAWHDKPNGIAVQSWQIFAVHLICNKGVFLHGFVNRQTTREGFSFAKWSVLPIVRCIHCARFESGLLQHLPQTHPCPFATANRAPLPRSAAYRRVKQRATIAATFNNSLLGNRWELGQVVKRQGQRCMHLSIDDELPALRVTLLSPGWNTTIVADKVTGARSHSVV